MKQLFGSLLHVIVDKSDYLFLKLKVCFMKEYMLNNIEKIVRHWKMFFTLIERHEK